VPLPQVLDASFPSGKAPHVMYLCGADHLLMCGPQTIKDFGCICCSRPGECGAVSLAVLYVRACDPSRLARRAGFTEELEKAVGKKYRRLVHIVDDDALLTTALDSVSSTKVRKRMINRQDITDLVGDAVAAYAAEHRIADKVAGRLPWSDEDKGAITFDVAVIGSE
jgi:nicotinic acid mononucleotide adenylyltransferase